MHLFSKKAAKKMAAYQKELIETHYQEVDNMYRQMRGWRHDYRNHIQRRLMQPQKTGTQSDIISIFLTRILPQ